MCIDSVLLWLFLDAVILWDVEGKFQIKVTRVTNLNVSKETAVRGEEEGGRGRRGRKEEREIDRLTDGATKRKGKEKKNLVYYFSQHR